MKKGYVSGGAPCGTQVDESWAQAMNRAIGAPGAAAVDVTRSCVEVSARLRAAAGVFEGRDDPLAVELLDVFDGARDFL
ncbi:hypothetical protein [Amycolatopsis sp. 195334CR]|uniref:hypothetical protein n=1 Tax=Amycolatopsis sp. 195334CR TaxID=2814588 RepID=UPI001A8D0EFD|nr:hypothetical protein [Amycolatopsis sp. 195334CR]MBN6034087.1 hypothetical protein [Amycolatopsis sp. 195334CR]